MVFCGSNVRDDGNIFVDLTSDLCRQSAIESTRVKALQPTERRQCTGDAFSDHTRIRLLERFEVSRMDRPSRCSGSYGNSCH